MRNLLIDNILPIIAGIASTLFGIYLITSTDPFLPRMYLVVKHLGANWSLFGIWIDLFLQSSIAFLVSSSLVAPMAYLFLRPHYQAKVASTSALCVFVSISILSNMRSSIQWQASNTVYLASLMFAESLCLFLFVVAWAKVGSSINSFLKKTKLN